MHRMILKSIISNYIKTVEVTFWETMVGQLMYTCLAIIGSRTRAETMNGTVRVYILTLNLTAI